MIQDINEVALQHKKALRQLNFQRHADIRIDLQRKQLIALKKLFQFKKDRLKKNLRKLQQNRAKQEQEKQINSWNKRLNERINNQQKVERLLQQANEKKKMFMQKHQEIYQKKWFYIQQEIKKRALRNHQKINYLRNNKNKVEKDKRESTKSSYTYSSLCGEFGGSFEKLLDSEVCEALNAALDMEDNVKIPFEPDDPIYKAAQFIMQHILCKFHKDLSTDKTAFKSVYERLDQFFDEAKKFVIFVSCFILQIIRILWILLNIPIEIYTNCCLKRWHKTY